MLCLLLVPVLAGASSMSRAARSGTTSLWHFTSLQQSWRLSWWRWLVHMWATESICGWWEASAHIWWPCSHPPIPEHSLTVSHHVLGVFLSLVVWGTDVWAPDGLQWFHLHWAVAFSMCLTAHHLGDPGGCWHQVGFGVQPRQHSEAMNGTRQPGKPHSYHGNAIKIFKDFLQKQTQMGFLLKAFKELQIRSYAPSCPTDLSFDFIVTNQIVEQRAGSWINQNSFTEVNSTAMLFYYQDVVQTSN